MDLKRIALHKIIEQEKDTPNEQLKQNHNEKMAFRV